ncbi:MAG: hypothetical protein HOE48_08925 [Candidatus Latescibacteria bacterium]|jgi:flagellar motor switch protein FliN|nr:hypothetical protein [Candidatus Latescibacterota bacterium]MBT4138025.1 hypothetical protein [Candidatus Latescibacterota bacterium]MBT5832819.1 hypothetical protein [Candidatus Latescibacterota bacterium]
MSKKKEKTEVPETSPVVDPNWPRDVGARLKRMHHVLFEVKIVLGRTELTLDELENLGKDSVVETTSFSGQPAKILVNDTLFGRGEIAVIGDRCMLRVTDLVKPETI